MMRRFKRKERNLSISDLRKDCVPQIIFFKTNKVKINLENLLRFLYLSEGNTHFLKMKQGDETINFGPQKVLERM